MKVVTKSNKSTNIEKNGTPKVGNDSGNAASNFLWIDMPIDPNEPIFCLCQNVSYGKMIMCDDLNVSIIDIFLNICTKNMSYACLLFLFINFSKIITLNILD